MSNYETEVQLYPELLRRLAAGERLASRQDETEKLAATALAVEALENQKTAQPKNGHDKEALVTELGIGALIGHAAPKIVRKLRGEPDVPETAAELMKSFRRILQEKEKAEAAKRMAVATGIGGAVAGGLAVKALDKDKKEAADKDDDKKDEKKKGAPPWVKDKEEKKEGADKTASPRAILDRIMMNFK